MDLKQAQLSHSNAIKKMAPACQSCTFPALAPVMPEIIKVVPAKLAEKQQYRHPQSFGLLWQLKTTHP